MERLTEFHNGIWGMSVQAVKDGYDKYSVFSKLAEYENTGLTPEEVTSIKAALEYSKALTDAWEGLSQSGINLAHKYRELLLKAREELKTLKGSVSE